jgi:ATP phosphoribosyltransferase
VVQKLGFSNVKFLLRFPKHSNTIYQDLDGFAYATSYPNTVIEYFNSFGVNVDIHQISGSVEIAPNIGLADAIVDIVSSSNNLERGRNNL